MYPLFTYIYIFFVQTIEISLQELYHTFERLLQFKRRSFAYPPFVCVQHLDRVIIFFP